MYKFNFHKGDRVVTKGTEVFISPGKSTITGKGRKGTVTAEPSRSKSIYDEMRVRFDDYKPGYKGKYYPAEDFEILKEELE